LTKKCRKLFVWYPNVVNGEKNLLKKDKNLVLIPNLPHSNQLTRLTCA